MKPWNLIDQTAMPDGKTITLHEHDGSYYIRVDGYPLMSTRQHTSEERLAELACAHLKGVRGARVLIGGLGLGFTLRAALALLAGDAKVVVAEILPAVIEWNRRTDLPLASDALADRRVTIVQQDVGEVIRAARGEFDSIFLDIDNGPAAVSTEVNQRLYKFSGVQEIYHAIRRGGCVAFWAAAPDPPFAKLLERAGFAVEVKGARAHGTSGSKHTIFVGRVGDAKPMVQSRPEVGEKAVPLRGMGRPGGLPHKGAPHKKNKKPLRHKRNPARIKNKRP